MTVKQRAWELARAWNGLGRAEKIANSVLLIIFATATILAGWFYVSHQAEAFAFESARVCRAAPDPNCATVESTVVVRATSERDGNGYDSCSGVILARREVRKSRISCRLSMFRGYAGPNRAGRP